MTTITLTGNAITRFQWVTIRAALKLEKLGMKRSRRPSARQIILRASGLPTGTSYEDLMKWCDQQVEDFS